jgi:hypothetical protein
MNLQAALWAAQELSARRALGAALEVERRRQRSPRLERCRNLNTIFSYKLAKEERNCRSPLNP